MECMSTNKAARDWRAVYVYDSETMWERWDSSGAKDPLVADGRFVPFRELPSGADSDEKTWVVESYDELIRLVGGLQYWNRDLDLWFRGEGGSHAHARPKALRSSDKWKEALKVQEWLRPVLKAHLHDRDSIVRDRSPLARLALLQHYGAGSPFLDVSRDPHVALAFALWWWKDDRIRSEPVRACGDKDPHQGFVSVFATPRISRAVNTLTDIGICVVDLMAELPSHCLRPHTQRAAFMGSQSALAAFLRREDFAEQNQDDLDAVRIARICVRNAGAAFENGPGDKGYFLRMYPRPAARKQDDGTSAVVDGDYLLTVLQHFAEGKGDVPPAPVKGFPDDATPRIKEKPPQGQP